MASDHEILKQVWEGKLPICFKLESDEVVELNQPDPFYLMVPRLSYFPLVIDKVRKYFVRYIASEKQNQDMWLEFEGQPIKWHLPIGVLFDMYMINDEDLPWNVIVHFDNFPAVQIFTFSTKEMVEAYFLCCLKEADCLKHRGKIIKNMQKKDHRRLWLGLVNDQFEPFWAVNRKLMEPTDEYKQFLHIPLKCYHDDRYTQVLVKPCNENGQQQTLQDLLKEVFPDKTEARVRTHGFTPPLETELQWMAEHLSYPDNFLHLFII